MSKSVLCSFHQIFSLEDYQIDKIIIPSIQRDYAQGRKNDSAIERIRKRFLNALKDGITGSNQLYLDFIYGFIVNGVLTPLDGQQRLTTLFLLYWYAAKKENISEEDYSFLRKFSYETRPSSNDFCRHLIDFDPVFGEETISSQIIDQSWYPYDWSNDPTINSMLNMIDKIDELFCDVNDIWKNLVTNKKIVFHFLSLEELGLTDDLYIKMNSRGKPLTPFECFKAELEQRIIDQDVRKRIIEKIDIKWTDFLWKYRNKDCLIDSFFLNFFRFLCDIISISNEERIQDRGYDEIDLLDLYFNLDNQALNANIEFLEAAFDGICDFGGDLKTDLFEKFLTNEEESDKTRLFENKIDLLKDCFDNYVDEKTKQRPQSFTFRRIVLLYAFVLYCMNKDEITEDQFRERIRIVNNLTLNSQDELVDRATDSRLPAIIQQTEHIILDGEILKEDGLNGFNAYQIDEELEKQQWRLQNAQYVSALNKLENHELLQGQVFIVGLDHPEIFVRFSELFKCDRDLVTCALLTICDYSRVEKGWRYTLGTKSNDSAWKFMFHKNRSTNEEETKRAVVELLTNLTNINDIALKEVCDNYLAQCEANSLFDWRYYFIKYPAFRPDKYGKYYFPQNEKYTVLALSTQLKLSEYSFNPFLKTINPNCLDGTVCGKRLKINNAFLYCEENRFVLKDLDDNQIDELLINQNNGVDTEERIKKYLVNPLV